jgi:two-component system copper resistance phosphate regulon response regulator CusR
MNPPPARILVVEDDTKVAAFLKKGLETQSYNVRTAADGREGQTLLREGTYDLVLLDLNLPYVSGLELCAQLRQARPEVPVLMLTALGTTADKLAGFDAGADDYLVKPFDFMELLARVRVLLKRGAATAAAPTDHVLRFSDLELDLNEKVARRAGQVIELTAREFRLLEYLLRNRGRVVSRGDIAEAVWDINFDTGTNVIDVYINYLRKKIDRDAPVKLIHTVVGMGYTLKEK